MPRPSNADIQRRNARSKRKIEDPTYEPVTTRPRSNPPPPDLAFSTASPEHWMDLDDDGNMEDQEEESEVELSDNEEVDTSLALAGPESEFESAFKVLKENAKRYSLSLSSLNVIHSSDRMFG